MFYKKDRIPSFDIRYSIFIIRNSLFKVSFIDQTGRSRPAAALTPETFFYGLLAPETYQKELPQ